jgi:hypothetical protein
VAVEGDATVRQLVAIRSVPLSTMVAAAGERQSVAVPRQFGATSALQVWQLDQSL